MNVSDILETLQIDLAPSLDASPTFNFLLFLIVAILLGRYTPNMVQLFVNRLAEENTRTAYQNLVQPVQGAFRLTGTFILISLSLIWLEEDNPKLYTLLDPFITFAVIASLAWLVSRVFRQFVRFYGIDLLRRLGREVDELLLVLETLFNVIMGFLAAVIFAQSQDFNLVGLIASLGIGGLAIAFAAQKILEQLLSTIVLYLDRPFIPGDYIRVTLSSGPNVYGRVESIGIRSTKLRTSAKSTLIVIPNSTLANLDIENVTRGKKVMVMLYLDFSQDLKEEDAALVKQVVTRSTGTLYS
ncbi:MAG: mechanosensitive ion channel, partial [Cyanothece sp. SIO2G6]|nr:mechanosensitive ion channel [Cyanothece sp. SIO2G6]